jgi:preprotein translocase subunit Sec63
MVCIKNKNGLEYFLIAEKNGYSFLKNCKLNQFVVVWKLHKIGGGFYQWNQGFYYIDDVIGACECFIKKAMPFENPCKINAYCQVCNVDCRHRLN